MTAGSVLVAGDPGDAHVAAVVNELGRRHVCLLAGTLPDLGRLGLTWEASGRASFRTAAGIFEVTPRTSVWWRRPLGFAPPDLSPEDGALLLDESAVLVPAALQAAGCRWVDSPWAMDQARLKTVQLATASKAGVRVPATMITSRPADALAFSRSHGPLVAKAASSGTGIAPFVDVVPETRLGLVSGCPTLLQERVEASHDVRIVTVGQTAWAWTRPREPGNPIDWRAADPEGRDFVLTKGLDEEGALAVTIATQLGLTMAVQDWLVGEAGPVFLEVNPQGQWLFLRDADALVIPALAHHLGFHGE